MSTPAERPGLRLRAPSGRFRRSEARRCYKCGEPQPGIRCEPCTKLYQDQYRDTHRLELAAAQRARNHANPRSQNERYAFDPEYRQKAKDRARRWRLANKARCNDRQRARRARSKAAVVNVPVELYRLVGDNVCHYCGGSADTWDHRVPLTRGGAHSLENLVRACRSCNSRKHTKTDVEFMELLRCMG